MKAVVLAGGAGRGLSAITGGKPKTLIPIAGKKVIEYVIECLIRNSINDIVLVTDKPHEFEDVTVKYGGLVRFEVRKQEGHEVIGAILTAKDELSKGSILFYGDTLVDCDAVKMIIDTFNQFKDPTLMVVPEEDVTLYGAIKVLPNGFVGEMIEKPKEPIEGYYAYGGLAILCKDMLELIESYNSFDKAVNEFINKGGKVRAAIWSGSWIDIGYPWNILEAIYFALNKLNRSYISSKASISSKAVIEGPVIIEDDAFIDHNVIIKGPAYIGRNTFIGAYSFIRPYTALESDVNVSSYVEVVWSSIQPYVTIGRMSFLGYSVVGSNSVIEPNVLTKLIVDPEKAGIKAIREFKRRREYFKIGAFISHNMRVKAYSVLEPGTLISS